MSKLKCIQVKDDFKAVASIIKVVDTPDSIVYMVDVNHIIKRQPPASTSTSTSYPDEASRRELVWINPGKRTEGNTKLCTIEFPHSCDEYSMFYEMSRYTLYVSFFRTELLRKQVEKQDYLYVEDK